MTAEGLRRLARDPASGWPIGPNDYRVVGKTRMLPYELLAPYMQARKPGRGPAKQSRKKRIFPPKQQGELMSGEFGLIKVRATSQGEVRWEAAGPAPEEIKYGTIVRGMSPAAARELAADLVRAANDAEASDG